MKNMVNNEIIINNRYIDVFSELVAFLTLVAFLN
ncbi:hypothetical protein YPC_2750 [Yersinia pestis biovar Medievalis str. Harbin 35]|nr:hypothetical protein YPC_2750 [Yersinia pestis biovar Medievalis str. Harbin 35]EEO74999.1 hypothetical protein YP516_2883 [Yersinia pestis Nepal516]